MANRSTKGASDDAAKLDAASRGLARLASSARISDDVGRAMKGAALLGRPLTAHGSRIQWEAVLSSQTDVGQTQQPKDSLVDWSKKLRTFEARLLGQHLNFTTVAKDLAFVTAGTYGALGLLKWLDAFVKVAEARKLTNLVQLIEPLAKLIGASLDSVAGAILRVGRALESTSAATLEAGSAEVSLMDLSAPQVTIPGLAGVALGEGIHDWVIKRSRLEGWLASHPYDEKPDVRLRKREMHSTGANTWHVTHAPQITVVVNGADAAHPRKIAEQMVMALQAHHSELDQKLADLWKRQVVRDERTGF